jgi:hypothetical protein
MSLQALSEQMLDLEMHIKNATLAVSSLHCYMDKVSVPIPDMSENVASSIIFFEVTCFIFHVAPHLTRFAGP